MERKNRSVPILCLSLLLNILLSACSQTPSAPPMGIYTLKSEQNSGGNGDNSSWQFAPNQQIPCETDQDTFALVTLDNAYQAYASQCLNNPSFIKVFTQPQQGIEKEFSGPSEKFTNLDSTSQENYEYLMAGQFNLANPILDQMENAFAAGFLASKNPNNQNNLVYFVRSYINFKNLYLLYQTQVNNQELEENPQIEKMNRDFNNIASNLNSSEYNSALIKIYSQDMAPAETIQKSLDINYQKLWLKLVGQTIDEYLTKRFSDIDGNLPSCEQDPELTMNYLIWKKLYKDNQYLFNLLLQEIQKENGNIIIVDSKTLDLNQVITDRQFLLLANTYSSEFLNKLYEMQINNWVTVLKKAGVTTTPQELHQYFTNDDFLYFAKQEAMADAVIKNNDDNQDSLITISNGKLTEQYKKMFTNFFYDYFIAHPESSEWLKHFVPSPTGNDNNQNLEYLVLVLTQRIMDQIQNDIQAMPPLEPITLTLANGTQIADHGSVFESDSLPPWTVAMRDFYSIPNVKTVYLERFAQKIVNENDLITYHGRYTVYSPFEAKFKNVVIFTETDDKLWAISRKNDLSGKEERYQLTDDQYFHTQDFNALVGKRKFDSCNVIYIPDDMANAPLRVIAHKYISGVPLTRELQMPYIFVSFPAGSRMHRSSGLPAEEYGREIIIKTLIENDNDQRFFALVNSLLSFDKNYPNLKIKNIVETAFLPFETGYAQNPPLLNDYPKVPILFCAESNNSCVETGLFLPRSSPQILLAKANWLPKDENGIDLYLPLITYEYEDSKNNKFALVVDRNSARTIEVTEEINYQEPIAVAEAIAGRMAVNLALPFADEVLVPILNLLNPEYLPVWATGVNWLDKVKDNTSP